MTTIHDKYDQMHSSGPILARPGFQGMAMYVIGGVPAHQLIYNES